MQENVIPGLQLSKEKKKKKVRLASWRTSWARGLSWMLCCVWSRSRLIAAVPGKEGEGGRQMDYLAII